ncbi:class I SAM-dependent methyltransferase [Pseudobutyrivibrio sp. MD2005]|uniref:class I SAM-dependent methyltransferase n=1 Tax=Pseudobutyrivibrio sp. MD2005 TaxID=1410616 RepID=UPI0004852F2C|nr:class I SAM-dependent methyltransferase [Pseudobutyrivibrio sp. MD2005]
MYISNEIDWISFLKGKNVYIWGFCEKGKQLSQKFNFESINVRGFIDNNTDKHGQHELWNVISFESYLRITAKEESMIVICSNKERDIKMQCLQAGITNFISVNQVDFGGGESHYDEQYFEWQKPMGKFGAKVSYRRFKPYVKSSETLVEFGCAGGYLLEEFANENKVGIEINDFAREYCRKNGIKTVKHTKELSDNYADVIISTHVLEHVERPLDELRQLFRVLKKGGKIVFYVPNESCDVDYKRSDIDNHLYTWNCLTLGNLFKAAGFFVYSVKNIQEVWPNEWEVIEKDLGVEAFDELSVIKGTASNINNCLIVAYK